ncbi:hypothetical protein Z043_117575 [Scleropages formosus]|uniref:Uncharacterized protein n=1 Tax=Scleropages formosus TaxID=113540 RepID=A0A0P7U8Y4_SCLFO|nr:hypothetical protein Z043_117575 [Scleropages formosus]
MFTRDRTSSARGSAAPGRDPEHRRFTVEGCPTRESPLALELSPRKRLHSAGEAQCSSRPPPEGAGSVSVSEPGHLERREGKVNPCRQCLLKVGELKRQALALADPGSLKLWWRIPQQSTSPRCCGASTEELCEPRHRDAPLPTCCPVISTQSKLGSAYREPPGDFQNPSGAVAPLAHDPPGVHPPPVERDGQVYT